MPQLFIGVDAGGSHTVAALARGEKVVRTVTGDTANPNVVGIQRAADAIAETIRQLLEGETPVAIGVGAAGAGCDDVRASLRSELHKRLGHTPIVVTDDAHIALRAAVAHGDGIVLVAGTGSIAYGHIADRSYRAGGYGYLLGDEGSGYAIGAAALHRFLEADEMNVPRDPLLNALATHFSVHQARDVLSHIYHSTTPVATVAGCAPLVLAQASAGISSAVQIVNDAAAALVRLVERVVQKAPTHEREPSLQLAFSGGLFKEPNFLADVVKQRISFAMPKMRLIEARPQAYLGALGEARRISSVA